MGKAVKYRQRKHDYTTKNRANKNVNTLEIQGTGAIATVELSLLAYDSLLGSGLENLL